MPMLVLCILLKIISCVAKMIKSNSSLKEAGFNRQSFQKLFETLQNLLIRHTRVKALHCQSFQGKCIELRTQLLLYFHYKRFCTIYLKQMIAK